MKNLMIILQKNNNNKKLTKLCPITSGFHLLLENSLMSIDVWILAFSHDCHSSILSNNYLVSNKLLQSFIFSVRSYAMFFRASNLSTNFAIMRPIPKLSDKMSCKEVYDTSAIAKLPWRRFVCCNNSLHVFPRGSLPLPPSSLLSMEDKCITNYFQKITLKTIKL